MGKAYQQALRLSNDRQSLLENQRSWLTQRDSACGSVPGSTVWSCIAETTKSRTLLLSRAGTPNLSVTPNSQQQSRPGSVVTSTPQGRTERDADRIPSSTAPNASAGDESIPWVPILILIVITVIAFRLVRNFLRQQQLVAKYGEEAAALIMARKVWQGMTAEQLVDSWGSPIDVGREIIRTRTKETWKYGQIGKNRFRNRVYLENGIVIGWKI